jgi:hypothetical protein
MKEGSSSNKFHQAVRATMDRDGTKDIIMKVKISEAILSNEKTIRKIEKIDM